VPHLNSFFEDLPAGTCLLGELYFPSKPGSRNVTTIMGCLKEKAIERQNKGEKLHFYVFDCLAWDGKSWLNETAKSRFTWVSAFAPIGYVSFAQYCSGRDLWAMLQEILARGDEGIVITREDGKYEPGKRPSKTTLKIKKELKQTIDCFFTGVGSVPTKDYTGKEIETWQYWENLRTGEKIQGECFKDYQEGAAITPVTKSYFHGWCGSLEIGVLRHRTGSKCKINGVIYDDTEVFPIGWLSGLTEEMKANPNKYAFQPIEVTAMEWDGFNHTLRHGKMVGWRKDLNIKDCTLEKIDN
jgi:ATP-dependent DNA ligase